MSDNGNAISQLVQYFGNEVEILKARHEACHNSQHMHLDPNQYEVLIDVEGEKFQVTQCGNKFDVIHNFDTTDYVLEVSVTEAEAFIESKLK